MVNKKQLAKPPMLYITQPALKPAEVTMQTSFRGKKQSSNTGEKTGTSSIEKEIRHRNKGKITEEPVQKQSAEAGENENQVNEGQEETGQEKSETPGERRQRFRDMSIEGKVNYFFNLPPHLPKMKCEVSTEEEQYRGYINKYEDGIVHMKVFQRPFQREIPFTEIQDIRLIGF